MSTLAIKEKSVDQPLLDILTDKIVQLLKDIKNKTLKRDLILFYGTGCNGKTVLCEAMRKVFRSETLSSSFVDEKCFEQYITMYGNRIYQNKNLELVFIQELEHIDALTSDGVLKRLKSLNVPVIVCTNTLPKSLQGSSDDSYDESIKVIRFEKNYSGSGKYLDDIINPESISALKECLSE